MKSLVASDLDGGHEMPTVSASEVASVLRREHKSLHQWRSVELWPHPELDRLLDRLGYPKDADIEFILSPLSQLNARNLPKKLDELCQAILTNAQG